MPASRRVIRVAIVVIVLGLLIRAVVRDDELRNQLATLSGRTFLIGSVFAVLQMLSLAYFLKVVVDNLANRIDMPTSLHTTAVSTLANYFLPFRGGAGVRAVYLKRYHGLSYEKFVVTLYGNYIILILVNATIAATLLLAPSVEWNTSVAIVFITLVAMASLAISLISPRLRLDELLVFLVERVGGRFVAASATRIRNVIEGWKTIAGDLGLLRRMIAVVIVNFFARLGMFAFLFAELGVDASIEAVVIIAAVTNLTIFVALTPGALGIREAVLTVFSVSVGVSESNVLAASLAERAVTLVTVGLLAAVLSLWRLAADRELPVAVDS